MPILRRRRSYCRPALTVWPRPSGVGMDDRKRADLEAGKKRVRVACTPCVRPGRRDARSRGLDADSPLCHDAPVLLACVVAFPALPAGGVSEAQGPAPGGAAGGDSAERGPVAGGATRGGGGAAWCRSAWCAGTRPLPCFVSFRRSACAAAGALPRWGSVQQHWFFGGHHGRARCRAHGGGRERARHTRRRSPRCGVGQRRGEAVGMAGRAACVGAQSK